MGHKSTLFARTIEAPAEGPLSKDITDCRSCLLFRMRPSQTLLPAVIRCSRNGHGQPAKGAETQTRDDGMARHRLRALKIRTARSPRRPSAAHVSAVALACRMALRTFRLQALTGIPASSRFLHSGYGKALCSCASERRLRPACKCCAGQCVQIVGEHHAILGSSMWRHPVDQPGRKDQG